MQKDNQRERAGEGEGERERARAILFWFTPQYEVTSNPLSLPYCHVG